jgi:thioredoxin 1
MKEWSEQEVLSTLQSGEFEGALYFYTPLCGTCGLAERMLAIVIETIPGLSIYRCNLNFMKTVVATLHIESAPCLIRVQKGKPLTPIYAFQSVDYLYQLLKPMARG